MSLLLQLLLLFGGRVLYSGDPSTSLLPPSFVPSDHGSEGRLLAQVPSESKGQRFYVISKSLGSKSKESISGWVDPYFTCRGINSSLLVRDLARIRKKYDLPVTFSLVVPEALGDVCSHQSRFVTCMRTFLRRSSIILFIPALGIFWFFSASLPASLSLRARGS